jgi:hypothetical protein
VYKYFKEVEFEGNKSSIWFELNLYVSLREKNFFSNSTKFFIKDFCMSSC